jgi:predicted esterase
VCHGYGQPAVDFIREFETIASPTRVIVAPEALSRYYIPTEPGYHSTESKVGASWMTSEDRQTEISDYVAYLDALYDEITSRVNRQAISVTCARFFTGWRDREQVGHARSLTHPQTRPMGFVSSRATVDLDQAPKFFSDANLTIVYGTKDKYVGEKMIRDYQTLLKEKTIPYELITFEGGHRMDRSTLKSLTRD